MSSFTTDAGRTEPDGGRSGDMVFSVRRATDSERVSAPARGEGRPQYWLIRQRAAWTRSLGSVLAPHMTTQTFSPRAGR